MNKKNYWQKYWSQTDAFTSLADDFSGNYDGEILDHWQSVFKSLLPGSDILDIACGNLPVPVIAVQTSELLGLDLKVSACDLVVIDKQKIQNNIGVKKNILDQISLYSEMNSEYLDFEPRQFDLVTSMFGFEYSDIQKTLKSIKKVLKLNGRAEFVCHYSESRIIKVNHRIHQSLKDLLASKGILYWLTSLSDSLGLIKTKSDIAALKKKHKSEKLRSKLNDKLMNFYNKYGEQSKDSNIIEFVKHYFSCLLNSSKQSRKKMINDYKNELIDHKGRLEDLLNASISLERLKIIEACCDQLSLNMSKPSVIYHLGHKVGMVLSIKKEG